MLPNQSDSINSYLIGLTNPITGRRVRLPLPLILETRKEGMLEKWRPGLLLLTCLG